MPFLFALVFLTFVADSAPAQTPRPASVEELKQLSIEELVDTDVTTASRRIERLADVAAAITVITSDDLRRMGVSTLPQALQLAGHLDVARASGPQYAISSRGFTISTANKLLVLIDGRTVYSPIFAGVFWEAQDVMIADVDRIEIIRGPGGSVWGANAVNGVINVISKKASDTRGTLVSISGGSSVLGPVAVRHGGRFGNGGSYRAYAKGRFEDSHQLVSGADANDDFDFGQMGFRVESDPSGTGVAFLQGDLYTGSNDLTNGAHTNISGGNLLARWTQTDGQHSSSVQAYYDHTYRRVPNQYRGVLNTFDVDAQHQWRVGRQDLVFGAGYRLYDFDDLGDGPGFFLEPRERIAHRFNVFVQDEISVARDVFLTVGSKFERNEFTGVEIQPTVRARWSGARRSLWGAVSNAVRVPTRFDTDLRFRLPGSTTGLFLTGSDSFESENVTAYEAGYRQQFFDRVLVDVAAYTNRYDDLRTQEVRPGEPIILANMMSGLTRGVETTSSAQLAHWWQIHLSHTYLWKELTLEPGSADRTGGAAEANDPRHIWKMRSYLIVNKRIELDSSFRRYGSRPQPAVNAYQELDARLGYRVKPGWELSLIGTDLLHDRHQEFRAGTQPETYERAVSLRSVWRF